MTVYTQSIWRPGPLAKQNGGLNTVKGVVCHSMVGYFAGAMARLDDDVTPAGRASWHYSVLQDGRVFAHYTDETQCWQAGSAYNNDTIGIEHEGGFSPEDEPLTDMQRAASVELVRWLSARHGFPLERGNGLWEHHEVSGAPTSCPSGRIPWQYYTADGGDEMWHRLNGLAAWWSNRVLMPGPEGTIALDKDFPMVPATAQAVDIEVFLHPGSSGKFVLKDGDGNYAGQFNAQRPQGVVRVVPVNRQAKFSIEGGGVQIDLLGILGYLG